jgi:mannose-6-phosphate isomerase-like protein (cupin superfamily)
MEKHNKGWGYELWIHNDAKYCGKLLSFVKGKKCSFHVLKHETFYVQSGRLKCRFVPFDDVVNEESYPFTYLTAGDSYEIPPYLVHQMEAETDVELFEFSTQHFDDDSHRVRKGD